MTKHEDFLEYVQQLGLKNPAELLVKPAVAPVIPKGMKEFNIDGEIIYALNYVNAVRKYAKKL